MSESKIILSNSLFMNQKQGYMNKYDIIDVPSGS